MPDSGDKITTYAKTWALAVEHKRPDGKSAYGFIGTFLSQRKDFPQLEGVITAQFYTKKSAVEYMKLVRARDPKYWNGRHNRLFIVRTVTVTTTIPRHDWERIWTTQNRLVPVVSLVPRRPANAIP